MLFSSLLALYTIVVSGLATYNHAARLPPIQKLKRIQQQNSIPPLEGDLPDDSGWVKLSPVAPHVSAHEGSSMELVCEAIGSPPPSISWYRDGTTIQDEDNSREETNQLPVWPSNVGAMAKVVSRLIIPCVSSHDADTIFTCVASSGLHSTTAMSTLRVLSPSGNDVTYPCLSGGMQQARIVLHNPLVMQLMGRDVLLECGTQGTPPPTVRWFGPSGNHLRGPRYRVLESGAIVITRINWTDMGEYTCIAVNDEGEEAVSTFLYPLKKDEFLSTDDSK